MESTSGSGFPVLLSTANRAIGCLLRAYEYARDAKVDIWQFAIEFTRLTECGLTLLDVQWLLARRFVQHAEETTQSEAAERAFRPLPMTSFPEHTCLVLTELGAGTLCSIAALLQATSASQLRPQFIQTWSAGAPTDRPVSEGAHIYPTAPESLPVPVSWICPEAIVPSACRKAARQGTGSPVGAPSASEGDARFSPPGEAAMFTTTSGTPAPPASRRPQWDADLRVLKFGSDLVKCYRVPAANQELILNVFQEDGWPDWIDDPLPPLPSIDPKRRLQATIKSLNRNQIAPLLRFHCNGNGRRVSWTVSERPSRNP